MNKAYIIIPALNHSVQHLNEIRNEIPFWTLEKQAAYADAVCRLNVNNPNMLCELIPEEIADLSKWNATSFGNLAYIALNSKSKFMRDYARGILGITKKHWRK